MEENVSMTTEFDYSTLGAINGSVNDSVPDAQTPVFTCGVTGNPYLIGGIILCTIGLLLNSSFVFVFCRVRYMRTLTNGYLVNLAVSDMLLLFSVFVVFIVHLENRSLVTRNINCAINYLHTMLLFVSIWMITIVSIERYLGICNPLKARIFNTRGRVITLIACTWLLGLLCAIPKLIECSLKESQPTKAEHAQNAVYVMYVIMFLASMLTVGSMYFLTVKNFKHSVKKLRKDRKNTKKSDEKQVLVTCMAISVVFFVCMLPSFYKYLIHVVYTSTGIFLGGNFTVCMYALSRWLLLINSSVNPLIYTITSARCRRAFVEALISCRPAIGYDYTSARRSSSNSNTLTTNVIIDADDMKRRELILKNMSI
ncbi:somatostatin receptor type 4-like [Ptychodera flava]|uniref:somatostatin receptor type 4-like n=1 Tax=Ptychodera flava TaxID=63121 RepID=UPI00396A4832